MSRPLRSVDISKYKDIKTLLKAIDSELSILCDIAVSTDFNNPEHTAQFSKNITYLKTYYEYCERLIRDKQHQ